MDDPLVSPVNKTALSLLPIVKKIATGVQGTWMYCDTKFTQHFYWMLMFNTGK